MQKLLLPRCIVIGICQRCSVAQHTGYYCCTHVLPETSYTSHDGRSKKRTELTLLQNNTMANITR
jgi:hypothetical protein